MRRLSALLLMCMAVTACAQPRPNPDRAALPPDFYTAGTDVDLAAASEAVADFADPSRMRDDPVAAARSVIAIEYLDGQPGANRRWMWSTQSTRDRLRAARNTLRAILGIAPDTPSQHVVDTLAHVARYLRDGDIRAARAVLSDPAFTLPPDTTLQRLSRFPPLPEVSLASNLTYSEAFPPGGQFMRR